MCSECTGLCGNNGGGLHIRGHNGCGDSVEEIDIDSLTETQKNELKTMGRIRINGEIYKLTPVLEVKVIGADGKVKSQY